MDEWSQVVLQYRGGRNIMDLGGRNRVHNVKRSDVRHVGNSVGALAMLSSVEILPTRDVLNLLDFVTRGD